MPNPEQLSFVPPSAEKTYRQEGLLLQLQATQAEELDELGLLDKALNHFSDAKEWPLTRVVVAKQTVRDEDGITDGYERYDLALLTTCLDPLTGQAIRRDPRHIPVAKVERGLLSWAEGFTAEEAQAVVSLAHTLRYARHFGPLADLSEDLTRIEKPEPTLAL